MHVHVHVACAQAYMRGDFVASSLIIGSTSKDGTAAFYGAAPLANATAAEWRAAMLRRWGPVKAPAVMARYSLERFRLNMSGVPAVSASYIEADADEVPPEYVPLYP